MGIGVVLVGICGRAPSSGRGANAHNALAPTFCEGSTRIRGTAWIWRGVKRVVELVGMLVHIGGVLVGYWWGIGVELVGIGGYWWVLAALRPLPGGGDATNAHVALSPTFW